MSSALKICPQCGTEYPANERFCPRDGTALRSQGGDTDLVGTIIADRYHVMKKLGEGGMGQVYLAEHVKMGRKSAVKVMNPGMVKDVDAISRFNREAANASRINHPNVAGIYDFGETSDGVIYLAMEFIEGQSLTSLIAQQGALAPLRAAEITRQAADGLSVAHDMGIVHRDLKPDNIMIAKTRDGGDLVKVVDFGIAKAAGSESQKVTKTGLVVGTPEYMSPEQLSGDKLDGRSDIYSLGLVAFNMLTGKLPFPSESMQETMIMRLTDKPKPLSEMKPDVSWPADVQAVMDKALERDVSLRYQTASQFGVDLYKAIERMPATKIAEAGTQIMGAAAMSAPASQGAATAALPATRVSAPEDLAPRPSATAPTAKKSSAPLIGAIAAVVVLGAGGWLYMGHNKGPAAGDPAGTGAGVAAPGGNGAQTSGTGQPQPQGRTTSAPTDSSAGRTKSTTSTGKPPAASGAGGLSASAVSSKLDSLDQQSQADNLSIEAGLAIKNAIEALRPSITTTDQNLHAGWIEASIEALRDPTGACRSFKDLQPQAAGTRWQSKITTMLTISTCPPLPR